MRTGRSKAPIVYNENTKFEIGKGIQLRQGTDVTLVACGLLVFEALDAADKLKAKGISASVIDIHTLKPIDKDLLIADAKKTGAVVTAEEHLIWGGLGSVVSQTLSQYHPVPVEFVGLNDTYAESGDPDELLNKYGLNSDTIVKAAEKVISHRPSK